MAERHAPRREWGQLVITSGLAAAITGLLGYAGVYLTRADDLEAQRCALAAQLLQDETPSPYMTDGIRQQLMLTSAQRFKRCMEER